MPVSFAFAYARPLHSIIDREEQEKYPFCRYVEIRAIYSWQCAPSGWIDHSEKVKWAITLRFQSCLTL